jgi:hypothetical protein
MSNAYEQVSYSHLNWLAKESYILKLQNSRPNNRVNNLVNMYYHKIITTARSGKFSQTFHFEGDKKGDFTWEENTTLSILRGCFPGVVIQNDGPKSVTFIWK